MWSHGDGKPFGAMQNKIREDFGRPGLMGCGLVGSLRCCVPLCICTTHWMGSCEAAPDPSHAVQASVGLRLALSGSWPGVGDVRPEERKRGTEPKMINQACKAALSDIIVDPAIG